MMMNLQMHLLVKQELVMLSHELTIFLSNALSAFDGESTLGDWILSIEDTAGGDQGTINTGT